MTTPIFRIRLADVERGKREYDWEIPAAWLGAALADTDATVSESGRITVQVSKNGDQVVLHGQAKAKVTMPCARTLVPVSVELDPEIILVLRPAPVVAPTHRGTHAHSSKKRAESSTAMVGSAAGQGNKKQKLVHQPETELSLEDAAEDFYQGEQIDLDDFLREFLILELPMMPLRSDLHNGEMPAISAAPDSTNGDDADSIDPRLRPLAEIASRLKKSTKE